MSYHWRSCLLCLLVGIALLAACGSLRSEAAYASTIPADIRPSFDLFAQRCSKCHSISRPLDSGIDDDDYWTLYVRRMRLLPGSGISEKDESAILPFLRHYAREQREKRARKEQERLTGSDAGSEAGLAPSKSATESTEAGAP